MKIKTLTLIFLMYIFCTGLSAQTTAGEIETLLGTSAVTYAQAARFVLEASDAKKTSNPQEAFLYAAEQGWLPENTAPDEEARLDHISLLFMHSFGLKGGLFYSIIKNPHYAYRELTYRNFIQGRADPAMKVSGDLLLFITGRILTHIGEFKNE